MSETGQTVKRRSLRFTSIQDILDEVQRLATGAVKASGQWSAATIVQHLAESIDRSIDGFGVRAPAEARARARAARDQMLRDGIPVGLAAPPELRHLLPDPSIGWDDALAHLRAAMGRLHHEPMTAQHPYFGHLSPEQWVQYHCRHSELHLGFLHPVDG